MNSYRLKRHVLGRQPSLELSRAEYEALLAARIRVLEHLAVEELFDLMMGNYEEFERELLAIALRWATFMGAREEWMDAVDTLHLVGRRFANLLTTTHAYCDQLPHVVSSLFGRDSPELQRVREQFRAEHAAQIGYRVCTELRKYMQHRGTAVHQLNRTTSWVTRSDDSRVRVYWVAPQVRVSRLREDRKFKSSVLAELEIQGSIDPTGDRLHDLRPFVREYVSALGRVHLEARTLLASSAASCEAVIVGAIDRFVVVGGADVTGLAAVELSERQLLEDRHPTFIMRDPIERRRALEQRNHLPTRFDTQVVTNEIV
jgi:hypothetical protein